MNVVEQEREWLHGRAPPEEASDLGEPSEPSRRIAMRVDAREDRCAIIHLLQRGEQLQPGPERRRLADGDRGMPAAYLAPSSSSVARTRTEASARIVRSRSGTNVAEWSDGSGVPAAVAAACFFGLSVLWWFWSVGLL